jgi:hypothetical protein
MASSSSFTNINEIKEVSGSYNLATEFKGHFNNEMTEDKSCLQRFVEEKKVEDRQVPLNETQHLAPLNVKAAAIRGCLVETQERECNRIILLTNLIGDITYGIREKEQQTKLMEVHDIIDDEAPLHTYVPPFKEQARKRKHDLPVFKDLLNLNQSPSTSRGKKVMPPKSPTSSEDPAWIPIRPPSSKTRKSNPPLPKDREVVLGLSCPRR